jgi:hypothetical protein
MDADMILFLLRGRKLDQYAHEHRDLFHRPILFTGIGTWMLAERFGAPHAWIWFIGTTFHFLHDTFVGGWGIKWLSPICEWYITYAPYSPVRVIRTKEQQRVLAGRLGNPKWADPSESVSLWEAIVTVLFAITAITSMVWLSFRY